MYMQMLNEVVDAGTNAGRRLSQAKLYKASASRTISFSDHSIRSFLGTNLLNTSNTQ
jgi:hypothetical protein